jgi:uncharacterized protein DUF222/HNH endonuclease
MKSAAHPTPDLVPIEELDQAIVNLCAHINASTYELLVLIREFEDRAGYLKWGLKDAAEWLSYRCDLGRSAAYEKVRVARALRKLPAISGSFSTGELSYSKVRALTRVAGDHNEQELLDFALRTTAARVEERCRELRFGTDDSIDVASRAYANRSFRMSRNLERGMMTVTVELPIETGELLEKALDKAREQDVGKTPEFIDESWSTQQADAFTNLVSDYLSGYGKKDSNTSDNYLVTIHVDQSALAGGEGRSALPIESVKRLCCDGHAVVITEYNEGEPLSIGRKTRIVPAAIKRAVLAKHHQCCAFPGCQNRRFLHCHHIEHWSNGGETSIENLMPLCTRHHSLIHEGRFRIETDYRNDWTFVRPEGQVIPPNGYLPQDMVDDEVDEVYKKSSAEDFLMAARNTVSEPPPGIYWH